MINFMRMTVLVFRMSKYLNRENISQADVTSKQILLVDILQAYIYTR